MNLEAAREIVIKVIKEALENKIIVSEDTKLIGGESLLDSIKLVEVCLSLEDIADEKGFDFDWTSETAMSKSLSIFRNVESLALEFSNQSEK